MHRLAPALAVLLAAAAASAQEVATAAPPERRGYAFDAPQVLAQQRIFGLAHAIRMLTLACRVLPTAAESDAAYAAWRTREGRAVAAAVADLSAYYFGGGTADWNSLVHKLALKETLDYAPDSPELAAACASLPAALERPRYDLAERRRLEESLAAEPPPAQ